MHKETCKETRAAFIWSYVLNTPFWAIYGMLPFILYKDLHGTPLQIAAMITLKPMVSLFAPYWSAWVNKRKDRLVTNVVWATFLGHAPFFFFPFFHSPWYFVASFGFYMLMARGMIPAWMEILKLNVPNGSRERIFAFSSAFEYVGAGLLPFILGALLDGYYQSWRWIFPLTSFVAVIAVFLQRKIPIAIEETNAVEPALSFKQQLIEPWKQAWLLLKTRTDFAAMQMGFMLGGGGLMILQPALPMFFMDALHLSYTELAIALTLCKGAGFAVTSPFWSRLLSKVDIYRFLALVTLVAMFFPIGLLLAKTHIFWLYAAYLLYGVMQAGSELGWNLSGPIFSQQEDSSPFSSVNVLTVGLRGSVIPPLGSMLCLWSNSYTVMVLGGILCLLASIWSLMAHRRFQSTLQSDVIAQ
ncbi:MAG: MFS transporter [Parachlamydia sp.]|nr:MFS transporter [Parachlamydia sp.]